MTRLCSSWLSVGLSPVVPTGTRPCVPSLICQSTKRLERLLVDLAILNGVMSAVIEPLEARLGCHGTASPQRRGLGP